jgi:hypothetical protein
MLASPGPRRCVSRLLARGAVGPICLFGRAENITHGLLQATRLPVRSASSSSKRWQTRQGNDKFSKEARLQGLMSRAAFKLLEVLLPSILLVTAC